jgi:carboxypeptidase T
LANWQSTNLANWNLTTEQFYSAPTSCTDSPNGDYQNQASIHTQIILPVQIPAGALSARLRYQARWELEPGFDYVTINVGTIGNLSPQCATSTGYTVAFVPNSPVYDGFKSSWTEECVDLTPWVGQAIQFGFSLVSDEFITLDGFYFDDVVIEYTLATGIHTIPVGQFGTATVTPNPAHDVAQISWSTNVADQKAIELTVYDVLGKSVKSIKLNGAENGSLNIDLSAMSAGMYEVVVKFAEGALISTKMQVKK